MVIQSLWIGPELSAMERLAMKSFLANGHEYHLFTYGTLAGVPPGVIVRDGCEILPRSSIFRNKDRDTVAGFSNFFRYKLLLERGGWWVDADVVCMRHFDFPQEHVFAMELTSKDQSLSIGSGVIKAPAGSPVMAYAWRKCEQKRIDQVNWGETGPALLEDAVKHHKLEECAVPYDVFSPIAWDDWQRTIQAGAVDQLGPQTRAVHLWNEMWRLAGKDKNGTFHQDCLYERLKRQHLSYESR